MPTLVTRDPELHRRLHRRARDVILKPLDGMGGSSIFRVRRDDVNRNVIIETMAHFGARSVMAQRFIPEIADGDKRILLIDGEPVPHALARIPKAGETRGNLAAGGRGVARPLTPRDREIAEAIGPALCAQGSARRRPRRDRRLPDRGQRDQPDRLCRDQPSRPGSTSPAPLRRRWKRASAAR